MPIFSYVMNLLKTQALKTYGYANIFMFGFGDQRSLRFMCDCFGGRTFLLCTMAVVTNSILL